MVDSAPLLHGYSWTTQPLRGLWMSEKLDGVRGYWDGAALWSRDMKPLHAPAWWLDELPRGVALDGELWCGRGRFGAVLGAVKSEQHAAWEQMRLMTFDLPNHAGPIEERLADLAEIVEGVGSPVLGAVDDCMCEGRRHLRAVLREVHAAGGEGLMLRQPGSLYIAGRSHAVLKVRIANNTELL